MVVKPFYFIFLIFQTASFSSQRRTLTCSRFILCRGSPTRGSRCQKCPSSLRLMWWRNTTTMSSYWMSDLLSCHRAFDKGVGKTPMLLCASLTWHKDGPLKHIHFFHYFVCDHDCSGAAAKYSILSI